MVELTIVMNCGTGTYETETFEDKKAFERAIQNVQLEHEKLICFTDKKRKIYFGITCKLRY